MNSRSTWTGLAAVDSATEWHRYRVRITCDGCGEREEIEASGTDAEEDRQAREAAVRGKARRQGWSVDGGDHRCVMCAAHAVAKGTAPEVEAVECPPVKAEGVEPGGPER